MRNTGRFILAVGVTGALALAASTARAADGGYLGVYLEDETVATRGAYVEGVAPESPAEKAGVRQGDLIIGWNGERTPNSHVLIERIVKAGAGDTVAVRLSRDDWEREVKIQLGQKAATPEKKAEAPKGSSSDSGERGFLGCYLKANPEGTGAFVDGVVEGSPAQKASLKKGDIIVAANGQAVKEYTAFQEFLKGTHAGQKLVLRVSRDGWEREVNVELGRRAGDRPAPPPAAKPAEPAPAPKPEAKKPAFLGVMLVDQDGKGPLKVDDVQVNSPAEKSAIKPGDVIISIGEAKVKNIHDFESAMKQHVAGDVIVVRLERDGWAREVKVTLGERQE